MGPATLKAINAKLKTTNISSITTITPPTTTTTNFSFTVPYKQGDRSEGAKTLQKLLKTLGLFSGLIDGVF